METFIVWVKEKENTPWREIRTISCCGVPEIQANNLIEMYRKKVHSIKKLKFGEKP